MEQHPDDKLTGDSDPFKGDPNFMASLARGLEVIQAFTPQRRVLSISQISQKRISSVHEVLKEGQKVKAKILNTNDGKVSLSMKALEDIMEKPQEEEEAEAIEYSSNETAGTSLGDLLSRFKL